jgi:hypothetical protein
MIMKNTSIVGQWRDVHEQFKSLVAFAAVVGLHVSGCAYASCVECAWCWVCMDRMDHELGAVLLAA